MGQHGTVFEKSIQVSISIGKKQPQVTSRNATGLKPTGRAENWPTWWADVSFCSWQLRCQKPAPSTGQQQTELSFWCFSLDSWPAPDGSGDSWTPEGSELRPHLWWSETTCLEGSLGLDSQIPLGMWEAGANLQLMGMLTATPKLEMDINRYNLWSGTVFLQLAISSFIHPMIK